MAEKSSRCGNLVGRVKKKYPALNAAFSQKMVHSLKYEQGYDVDLTKPTIPKIKQKISKKRPLFVNNNNNEDDVDDDDLLWSKRKAILKRVIETSNCCSCVLRHLPG